MTDIQGLNRRRKAIRLSMAELAQKAGLNKDTVWRAFKEQVDSRHSTLTSIARVIAAEEATLANRLHGRVSA